MYAVFQSGGKQHPSKRRSDRSPRKSWTSQLAKLLEFAEVLMIANGEEIQDPAFLSLRAA